MFCKSCGKELPTGAAVCENCGKKVETIMVVEEEAKAQSVATSAPKEEAPAPERKSKKKPDGLVLPAIMLIISGGGLFYLYAGNTFNSIIAWIKSSFEEKSVLNETFVSTTDPVEWIVNIAVIVGAVLLAVLGVAGLVVLFRRLGRKAVSKKD